MYPYKNIITLLESGISIETIAFQMDLDVKEVANIIDSIRIADKEKDDSVLRASKVPKLGMLLIDPVFNIDSAIKDVQKRTWYNIKVRSEFNISQKKYKIFWSILLIQMSHL